MIDIAAGGLVGRDGPLSRLATVLDRAAAGVGGVVLVSGEAGIGKTALCEAAVLAVRGQGWNTGWAAATPMPTIPGLWPWRRLLAGLDGGDLPTPPTEGDPVAARVAQFEAILQRLASAGRAAPVLAVLDDAHWADPATLALVLYVASASRSLPSCVLVTYRPEDAGAGTPLGEVLPRLRRLSVEVDLAPLGPEGVAALAAQLGGQLSEGAVEELVAVSRGNPLFVCEVVRHLDRRLPESLGQLPASPAVSAIVSERIGRLSHQCQELLALAAVLGAEADVAFLARAAAAAPADVVSGLDEAVAAAVLVEQDEGRFDFRHPLFRAAVYDSLGTAGRARLHARIATALEAVRAEGRDVELAALAHHFGRSAPLGHAAKATRFAMAAGDEAMAGLAYETASRRYSQALATLDLDPSGGDRIAMLLARAGADAASGRRGDAAAGYDLAADLAAQAGRAGALALAALGRSGGEGMEIVADGGARSVLDRALAAVGGDQPALRARLLARLSVVVAPTGHGGYRKSLLDEASTLVEAGEDPLAVADVAVARCHFFAGPSDVGLRLRETATVVREATGSGQVRLELLGRRLRVEALLEAGRLHEARADIAEYEARARLVRDPSYDYFVPLWRGALAAAAGDDAGYRRERARLEELLVGAPVEGDGRVLAAVQELFHLLDSAGDPGAARAVFESVAGSSRRGLPPQVAITDALLTAAEGRTDAARALLADWAPTIRDMPRDAEWLAAVVQLADIAAITGRHVLSQWALEQLEPYGAVWAIEGIGAALRGPAARALAALATVAGDHATAARWRAESARLALEAGASACARPVGNEASAPRLAKVGEVWDIEFGGVLAHVRDCKGIRDIAELLCRPGTAVAALELAATGASTVVQSPAGPRLDEIARAQYRRRLTELDGELDEADNAGDHARSSLLAAERDSLVAELRGAYGLGGRVRAAGSSSERARTAVTTRVKDALRRLDQVHPAAALHLRRSIKTGTFCVYAPDSPLEWEVRRGRG